MAALAGAGRAVSSGFSSAGKAVSSTASSGAKKAKDIYKNFANKCKEISFDLKQNNIQINSDDALADKTFFAFLADLLRKFKKDKGNNLINELKDNEKLTTDRLELFLETELNTNQSLTNELKQNIQNILNTEDGKIFTFDIFGGKIKEINDFRAKAIEIGMDVEKIEQKLLTDSQFDISAKDVQKLTAGISEKIFRDNTKETTQEVVKQATKMLKK